MLEDLYLKSSDERLYLLRRVRVPFCGSCNKFVVSPRMKAHLDRGVVKHLSEPLPKQVRFLIKMEFPAKAA